MLHSSLSAIGLNKKEIDIFLSLIELGTQPASIIGKKLNIPRNTARFTLDQLFKKNLVTKSYQGNVQMYSPIEPESIPKVLEIRKNRYNQTIDKQIELIKQTIPEIQSMRQKDIIMPKIKFYEGLDGIEQVLNDSLKAKEEIYTYSDINGMIKHMEEINNRYIIKRQEHNVKKKAIILDTPFAKKYLKGYYPNITEFRTISHKLYPYALEMEIYDNKISYLTFSEDNLIGIIIENKEIYEMNRAIFKFVWDHAIRLES